MSYLAIDYGAKNIGIAIADKSGIAVKPLGVVNNNNSDYTFAQIDNYIGEWHSDHVITGLPLNAEGEETVNCKIIRKFINKLVLKSTYKFKIDFYPEYFSTSFSTQGLSRKNKQAMGDAYAAAYILKKYLEWQSEKSALKLIAPLT